MEYKLYYKEKAKEYCNNLIDEFRKFGVEQVVLSQKQNSFKELQKSSIFSTKSKTRQQGQMFGILVCLNADGREVVLKAFSGQFQGIWNIPGWVPPLLNEDEFIKLTHESDKKIHEVSFKIDELSQPQASKKTDIIFQRELQALKEKRKKMSQESMAQIFSLYKIPCLTSMKTVAETELINPKNGKVFPYYILEPVIEEKTFEYFWPSVKGKKTFPPTGAGECCGPKLLAEAFRQKLRPMSMAEFYFGPSNNSGTREDGKFYPSCTDKCSIIIPKILSLEIIYLDENIIVVNKPSGLLSVPGRGAEKQDSVVNRVKYLFPQCMEQPSVHRLDMDTSGLLLLAFNPEAHRYYSQLFMDGKVHKKYVARLERPIQCGKGVTITKRNENGDVVSGEIKLPFRLDVDNRPMQIYDEVYGKMGHTIFNILENSERPLVEFIPITGRTHQLRLHASSVHGLNSPICFDNLYGSFKDSSKEVYFENNTLMLQAYYLEIDQKIFTIDRKNFF